MHKLKLPDSIIEPLPMAMYEAGMAVPGKQREWEMLVRDITTAAARLYTPQLVESFERNNDFSSVQVSLLVRDALAHHYDFLVSVCPSGTHLRL